MKRWTVSATCRGWSDVRAARGGGQNHVPDLLLAPELSGRVDRDVLPADLQDPARGRDVSGAQELGERARLDAIRRQARLRELEENALAPDPRARDLRD